MSLDTLPFSPAAERNKQPILECLQALLPEQGHALEIASGPGQHVVWFAEHMPGWHWQPTENDVSLVTATNARVQLGRLQVRVRPAHALDVTRLPWTLTPGQAFDAIFCANLLHIAPWDCCAALVRGAARTLAPHGLLVTYGPYLEGGVPTAPGNLEFDASLRQRNPAWGLRRLEDVVQQAAQAGLQLDARHRLPANNLLLVFTRRPPDSTPANAPSTAP